MKNKFKLLLVSIITTYFLTACGRPDNSTPDNSTPDIFTLDPFCNVDFPTELPSSNDLNKFSYEDPNSTNNDSDDLSSAQKNLPELPSDDNTDPLVGQNQGPDTKPSTSNPTEENLNPIPLPDDDFLGNDFPDDDFPGNDFPDDDFPDDD